MLVIVGGIDISSVYSIIFIIPDAYRMPGFIKEISQFIVIIICNGCLRVAIVKGQGISDSIVVSISGYAFRSLQQPVEIAYLYSSFISVTDALKFSG